jgi:hypothetical protein
MCIDLVNLFGCIYFWKIEEKLLKELLDSSAAGLVLFMPARPTTSDGKGRNLPLTHKLCFVLKQRHSILGVRVQQAFQ